MFDDVIHGEVAANVSTLRTGIAGVDEHLGAQVTPLRGAVPLAEVPVGAWVTVPDMERTAPTLHQLPAAGVGTVLH